MPDTKQLVKLVSDLDPDTLRRELQEAQERARVLSHLLRAAESSQRVRRGRAYVRESDQSGALARTS